MLREKDSIEILEVRIKGSLKYFIVRNNKDTFWRATTYPSNVELFSDYAKWHTFIVSTNTTQVNQYYFETKDDAIKAIEEVNKRKYGYYNILNQSRRKFKVDI